MSKSSERLTILANLSVIAGVVFLASELRQNTHALQAQTRDAITGKQMEWYGMVAASSETANTFMTGSNGGLGSLAGAERTMFVMLASASLREWENSFYQYEQGLFTESELEARRATWGRVIRDNVGYRDVWQLLRSEFAPNFRAEVDRILEEVTP